MTVVSIAFFKSVWLLNIVTEVGAYKNRISIRAPEESCALDIHTADMTVIPNGRS